MLYTRFLINAAAQIDTKKTSKNFTTTVNLTRLGSSLEVFTKYFKNFIYTNSISTTYKKYFQYVVNTLSEEPS